MTQDSIKHFIATIETDRDSRIEEIRANTDTEIKQILSDAHARSRQLQRDTNQRLRHELSNRRHKETSRIQARLRRQLWHSLTGLQRELSEHVLQKLQLAWKKTTCQEDLCRFWLDSALTQGDIQELRVVIDETVLPETLEFIRQWADDNNLDLKVEATLHEEGLMVYWQDFELDGRINALDQTIEREVLARLAPMMPHLQQVESL